MAVEEEVTALDREGQLHPGAPDDPGDAPVPHRQSGEHRQVAAAGAVPSLQPVGGDEVRAAQPELAGAAVHQDHEASLGAGNVVGERDRSVVSGDDQQTVQEGLEAYALVLRQHADG